MTAGNVSIAAGGTTLATIPASGAGYSFLQVLYRYANLTLPYSPNDPGLTYTYDNSTLVPVVLLYARFFNLLNEPSVPLLANVGTTAFVPSGQQQNLNCLDVRSFGAAGNGTTDDTASIQKALDQAHQNFLGNQGVQTATAILVQSITNHIENGHGGTLTLTFPLTPVIGNMMFLAFSAFDYAGSNSNAQTVTDNNGTFWRGEQQGNDGEVWLYTYMATVTTSAPTTITITIPGLQFNSFIAAIAAEFSGVDPNGTPHGSFASIMGQTPPGPFVPAPISPYPGTGESIVLSAVVNAFAAGVNPQLPPTFQQVGYQNTPQQNGLNGAVPVTALAFSTWTMNAAISPVWGGNAWGGVAFTFSMSLLKSTGPATGGLTTVCIPQGVTCMVNPIALDEANFAAPSCRYGRMAYSLLIDDGVTLEIDGTLLANPAATESMVSSTTDGSLGWALIMNKAWIGNKSLLSGVHPIPGGAQFIDGVQRVSIQSATGPQVMTSTIQTTSNDMMLWVGSSEWTHSIAGLQTPTTPALFTQYPSIGTTADPNVAWTNVLAQNLVTATSHYNGYYAMGTQVLAAMKALIGHTPTFTALASAGNITPFSVNISAGNSVAVPAGSMLIALVGTSNLGVSSAQDPNVYLGDSKGNTWTSIIESDARYFDPAYAHVGCQSQILVCFNPVPVPAFTAWTINVTSGVSGIVNYNVYVYVATGLGACGLQVDWQGYLAGTAFSEGPRNTGIGITGSGQVLLNGDVQSAKTVILSGNPVPGNGFYPTALARFVCADNSTIGNVNVLQPYGVAIQWLNSTGVKISNTFIHDSVNAGPYNPSAIIDPGIIEIDLMRNSTLQGNTIQNAPACRGILDWGGYQNTIVGNTLNTCYTGYEFRDCAGESGYFFPGPVTHNTEISGNKAINCTTAPASPGSFGSAAGSNGFLFYAGFYGQPTRSSSTGTSFHDNIGNNNSTDFSYTTYTGFRVNQNNTFGTSPGAPPGGTNNNQNIITGEVPNGAINGSNATFSLAHIPITSTVQVYLNGLLQTQGTDYVVSTNTITFALPPNSGSTLVVNYQYLTGN